MDKDISISSTIEYAQTRIYLIYSRAVIVSYMWVMHGDDIVGDSFDNLTTTAQANYLKQAGCA
ncbi:hypothetical protein KDA_68950 [Dictyobacter alpinus]|uniref:Uncharacterized protein n=1 Tax=Dictyobacter alpinus TaxID=2014873 RepID=A0A402BJ24_9CHLR|nr:hypothetical protein KDA_68950 [Dictyobacter alpinus]